MNHVTIVDNDATGSDGGGGIYATANLAIENSIVARNTAVEWADIRQRSGDLTPSGVNLIGSNEGVESEFPQGALVGTSTSRKAPGVAVLYDHGGLTPTMALAFDSPARDVAAVTASSPSIDQRALGRPFGSASDLGAFEATNATGGYGFWVASKLPTGSDFSISGDPDGDGLNNLKEYSLKAEPGVYQEDPDENEIVEVEGSGTSHLLLRFPHRDDAADLVIEVRGADDVRELDLGGDHIVVYRFENLARAIDAGFVSVDDSVDPPVFEIIDTESLEQNDRRFLQAWMMLR